MLERVNGQSCESNKTNASSDEILDLKFIQIYRNKLDETEAQLQLKEESMSMNDIIALDPSLVNNKVFELRVNKLSEDTKGTECTYAHIIVNEIKKSKDT